MKALVAAAFIGSNLILMASCSSNRDTLVKDGDIQPTLSETFKEQFTEESILQHISKWPAEARNVSEQMIKELGVPHGVTEDMLEWNSVGNYHRTIVHKEGVHHDSPHRHIDLIEHFTTDRLRFCEKSKMNGQHHARSQ